MHESVVLGIIVSVCSVICLAGYIGQIYIEVHETKRDDFYYMITNTNSAINKGVIATDVICMALNIAIAIMLVAGVDEIVIVPYIFFFISGVAHFVILTILLVRATSCQRSNYEQVNNAVRNYNSFQMLKFRRQLGVTNSSNFKSALDDYLYSECTKYTTLRKVFYSLHSPIFVPFVVLPLAALACAICIGIGALQR